MHLRAPISALFLLVLAPAAAAQDFKATLQGDLAHSYTMLPSGRGTLPAPAGVPAGADIVFATIYFEYFASWSAGASDCGTDQDARLQNATVQIGTGPVLPLASLPHEARDCDDFLRSGNGGNCATNATLHAHRIDLRGLLSPGQSITLTGMPTSSIGDSFATLLVAYCSDSGPVRDLVVLEDLQVDTTAPGRVQFAWGDLGANGGAARLLLGFGDAEQRESVRFNGRLLGLGTNDDGVMDDGIGFRNGYGLDAIDVSALVGRGDRQATLDVEGLCFYVHVVALAVTTDEAPGRALELGRAVAGAGGFEPRVSVTGCPVAGGHLEVVISGVRGGALGCLVIGEGRSSAQFLCGDMTFQRKLLLLPHVASGVPGQPGAGSASWSLRLPLAFFGREAIFQSGYVDSDACRGVSLTRGVALQIGG